MEVPEADTTAISDRLMLEWVDERTALLTLDSTSEVLLCLPSEFPRLPPILAMQSDLISHLHCPLDLTYSDNKAKLLNQAS